MSSSEEERRNLTRMMFEYFQKLNYTELRAHLPGETPPKEINGYMPDLTCRKNDPKGTMIILKVENCSSMDDPKVHAQWKTFHEYSKKVDGEFHLVVPDQFGRDKVYRRLRELDIPVKQIWSPSEEKPTKERGHTLFEGHTLFDILAMYPDQVKRGMEKIIDLIDWYPRSAGRTKYHLTVIFIVFLAGLVGAMFFLSFSGKVSGEALIFFMGTLVGYVFAFLQRYLGLSRG